MHTATAIAQAISGRQVKLGHTSAAPLQGMLVLWYLDGGMRKFVLLRHKAEGTPARFVSAVAENDQPIDETLFKAATAALGKTFTRAFERNLLGPDRVAATVLLRSAEGDAPHESHAVHTLCWLAQITREQAQLCASALPGMEVLAVPEFSIMSKQVDVQHRVVYQALGRHLNDDGLGEPGLMVDRLEEFLKKMGSTHKMLH